MTLPAIVVMNGAGLFEQSQKELQFSYHQICSILYSRSDWAYQRQQIVKSSTGCKQCSKAHGYIESEADHRQDGMFALNVTHFQA